LLSLKSLAFDLVLVEELLALVLALLLLCLKIGRLSLESGPDFVLLAQHLRLLFAKPLHFGLLLLSLLLQPTVGFRVFRLKALALLVKRFVGALALLLSLLP
jgi:hypothetical protein